MQGRAHAATRALVPFCCFLGLLFVAACDTKAVAIQECRDIESARCEASVPCGVVEPDAIDACKRFYNDQCLHGISGSQAPTADEQKLCLELIDAAGEEALETIGMGGAHALACEVVSRPWDLPHCSFLLPTSEEDEDEDEDEDEE